MTTSDDETVACADPDRRAFHRDLDHQIRSSLRVARIDQRSLHPTSIPRAEWMDHPADYLATVCWLLGDATRDRFRSTEQAAAEAGDPPQRRLGDYV